MKFRARCTQLILQMARNVTFARELGSYLPIFNARHIADYLCSRHSLIQ
jgi:hypothetical protein